MADDLLSVLYLVPVLYEGVHLSFFIVRRRAGIQERIGWTFIKFTLLS